MSLRFPWKADDEGGPKTDFRESGPDLLQEVVNLVASQSSAHAFENLIIDMLDREIEIGTDLLLMDHEFEKAFGKIIRFGITVEHSDPTEPLHSDQTLQEFF